MIKMLARFPVDRNAFAFRDQFQMSKARRRNSIPPPTVDGGKGSLDFSSCCGGATQRVDYVVINRSHFGYLR